MSLNAAKELGKKIAQISNDQSELKDNVTGNDPSATYTIANFDKIKMTGTVIGKKRVYKTDSFIIDHPVYGCINVPTSLQPAEVLSWYPLKELDFSDLGTNAADGVIAGTLTATDDQFGVPSGATEFNTNAAHTATNYLAVPTINLTTNTSISFWHYTRSLASGLTGADAYKNSRDGFFGLSTDNHDSCIGWEAADGRLMIQDITGNTWSNGTGLSLNTWQHIVITFDALMDAELFINSVSVSTYGSFDSDLNFNRIGVGYAGLSHDGFLSDILIVNKVLSQTEIDALYDGGKYKIDGGYSDGTPAFTMPITMPLSFSGSVSEILFSKSF